jgi:predicted Ser/Thr protein kinase
MKTALDWLIEQMPYEFRAKYAYDLFKQAKELEKEQIIKAADKARITFGDEFDFSYEFADGEEYYNQTYEQQKQHIIDIMKADEDDGLYNQNI